MISLAEIRRVGPWLLGLFLLAQAGGVMPLISIHLQHAYASEEDAAADLKETGGTFHQHQHHVHHGQGQHEHGAIDPGDQCCTLHHHLAAVLSVLPAVRPSTPAAKIVPAAPHQLASAERYPLERPPKNHSSI